MLGQRRRRWANVEPTKAQCLVFDGYVGIGVCSHKIMFHCEEGVDIREAATF